MGSWDQGPFDSDAAADWCGDLDDAEPADRPEMIRAALAATADETGYLDSHEGCAAIAAAAIVASTLPGGEPITSVYAPDFLLEGGSIRLPEDLAPLAVKALDRVMGEDSEWRELWVDAFEGYREEAFESVRRLRAVLATNSN